MSHSASSKADAFANIDVHDDTVESVSFMPATRRTKAKVQVVLFRYWEKRRRVLEFTSCANVEFRVDADILKGNSPPNTSRLSARDDVLAIQRMINNHKRVWGVTYDRDPIVKKLAEAKRLTLFRVQFFGGRLEVIAGGYKMRHLTMRSSGP